MNDRCRVYNPFYIELLLASHARSFRKSSGDTLCMRTDSGQVVHTLPSMFTLALDWLANTNHTGFFVAQVRSALLGKCKDM